ncbi:MAG: diguanylate cyclase [Candidatus Omnitrophota bacterium]|nr:diguanylate cyclase [Candidatus Omnitrophota bacterium]
MKSKEDFGLLKRLSLVPVGLRRKLLVSFSLMSIIPLLISIYLTTTYAFPIKENILNVSIIIIVGMFIALTGFYLTRSIVDSVIELSSAARKVADGYLEQIIKVEREDEIGDLENSLQTMVRRLRRNMSEIQSYGEKVRGVNVEISKKVAALSSLLQIGNVMAASPGLDATLPLVLDKISQATSCRRIFLMLLDRTTNELVTKFSCNINPEELPPQTARLDQGFLGKIAGSGQRLIIDRSVKKLDKQMQAFINTVKINNACFIPVGLKNQILGLLVMGNNLTDFVFQKDELELIKIFVRQIAIAVENDRLTKKTAQLTLKDELTGLYNKNYMDNRLKEEIKRAIMYQRPCSFVMFNVDDFKAYKRNNSELAGASILKKIAMILKENVSEVDRAARREEDTFVLILPEKNKGEALQMVERVRKAVEEFSFPGEKGQPGGRLTVSAGISANPIDGLTAEDLAGVAVSALEKAKKEGKNKVVI